MMPTCLVFRSGCLQRFGRPDKDFAKHQEGNLRLRFVPKVRDQGRHPFRNAERHVPE